MEVKDRLDFVLEIVNHPELQQDDSVRKWLKDKENRRLYDSCRLYIEVGIRRGNRFSNGPKVAFREFKERMRRKGRRRFLLRFSVAASVFVITGLFGLWQYGRDVYEKDGGVRGHDVSVLPSFLPGKACAVLVTESGKSIVLDRQRAKNIQVGEGIVIGYDSLQRMHYTLSGKEEVHYHVLRVPKGGEYKLVLDDGTVVWLNSESEFRYPTVFRDSVRGVELKGEGYFSVVKNSRLPFVVSSSGIRTKVYGTEFNVRSYSGEPVNVTLVKGSISVTNEKEGEEYGLVPGENACFEKERPKISRIDVRRFTAWKSGSFYYKNESLEKIMSDLQRWYNFKTVYVDKELKNFRFELWVDRNCDFRTIVDLLMATNKIAIKMEEREIIVSEIKK
ncbi:FecR family protein [Sanguibacteroides justesenii]|uniref:FecR family protein n=1 Tax=Sanguibacteroides justesenii TaxID=1547597 RepID=UPI0006966A12|nr:FecR family protein [Sanguibacteroides justesenii]